MSKLGGWRLRRWRSAGADERPARVERRGALREGEDDAPPEERRSDVALPPPDPHVMQLSMGKSFRARTRPESDRPDPLPKPVPIRPERRV